MSYTSECCKVEKKKERESGCVHYGKVICPERQGPTTQTKRMSKHRSLLQQVGRHMGLTTRLSGRPCPASFRPTPKP
eukprot:1147519-Pelagomonas_calceolata.AAC.3